MPGSVRTRYVLGPPNDRPLPSATSTSTSGPHACLAAPTTAWKPRVRLLAPTATTLVTRSCATAASIARSAGTERRVRAPLHTRTGRD